MSKQKSSSKGKASDEKTLDANLIAEEKAASETPLTSTVSLKEYSKTAPFAFDARNYKYLLVGLGINILGFLLMIGGAAEDPNEFNADALFSHTRITVAPILIVLGYVVIFYAIVKKNVSSTKEK